MKSLIVTILLVLSCTQSMAATKFYRDAQKKLRLQISNEQFLFKGSVAFKARKNGVSCWFKRRNIGKGKRPVWGDFKVGSVKTIKTPFLKIKKNKKAKRKNILTASQLKTVYGDQVDENTRYKFVMLSAGDKSRIYCFTPLLVGYPKKISVKAIQETLENGNNMDPQMFFTNKKREIERTAELPPEPESLQKRATR